MNGTLADYSCDYEEPYLMMLLGAAKFVGVRLTAGIKRLLFGVCNVGGIIIAAGVLKNPVFAEMTEMLSWTFWSI